MNLSTIKSVYKHTQFCADIIFQLRDLIITYMHRFIRSRKEHWKNTVSKQIHVHANRLFTTNNQEFQTSQYKCTCSTRRRGRSYEFSILQILFINSKYSNEGALSEVLFTNQPLGNNKPGSIDRLMYKDARFTARHVNDSGRQTCVIKRLDPGCFPT